MTVISEKLEVLTSWGSIKIDNNGVTLAINLANRFEVKPTGEGFDPERIFRLGKK